MLKKDIVKDFVSYHRVPFDADYDSLVAGEYGEVREVDNGSSDKFEVEIRASESVDGGPRLFCWGTPHEKAQYTISVHTACGWRGNVTVTAMVKQVSSKMYEVLDVWALDGEKPRYGMSRTGAKRQQYNGLYFATQEIGKKKRASSLTILLD